MTKHSPQLATLCLYPLIPCYLMQKITSQLNYLNPQSIKQKSKTKQKKTKQIFELKMTKNLHNRQNESYGEIV
jgi:hypothetical protein